MNLSDQITMLYKELKKAIEQRDKTLSKNEKGILDEEIQELRKNIQSLAGEKIPLNLDAILTKMIIQSAANILCYKIYKSKKINKMVKKILDLGVPLQILFKEYIELEKYLKKLDYDNPEEFKNYYYFIRLIAKKTYERNEPKKELAIKDEKWMREYLEKHDVSSRKEIHIKNIRKAINQDVDQNLDELIQQYMRITKQ